MNGAWGFEVKGFSVTDTTVAGTFGSASAKAAASMSLR